MHIDLTKVEDLGFVKIFKKENNDSEMMKIPLLAGVLAFCVRGSALSAHGPRSRGMIKPLSTLVRSHHQAGQGQGQGQGSGGARSQSVGRWLLGGAMITGGAVLSQQQSMQLSAGAEGAEGAGFLDTALYPPTKPIQSAEMMGVGTGDGGGQAKGAA